MADIQINKDVFPRSFDKVIDTTFSQLIKPKKIDTVLPFSVADFFIEYDKLFYQIPKEGDVNSHQFLVDRSSDYLGLSPADVEALLAEITALRQQLLEANQEINTLLANQKS